jgi:RHS repeat-associated protein
MGVYEKAEQSQQTSISELYLYASDRVGVYKPNGTVYNASTNIYSRLLANKSYELKDHLGNVRAVISDELVADGSTLVPALHSVNNYYSFGMEMTGRNVNSNYRYGFNGKEKDSEFQNNYDYGFRIYNAKIAKFLSVDPLTKQYPWYTPYQFAGNKPIAAIDLDGAEEKIVIHFFNGTKNLGQTEVRVQNPKDLDPSFRLYMANSLGWKTPFDKGTVHARADINNFNGINFVPYDWEASVWDKGVQWARENLAIKKPDVVGFGGAVKGGDGEASASRRLELYSTHESNAGASYVKEYSGAQAIKLSQGKKPELSQEESLGAEGMLYMYFKWGEKPTEGYKAGVKVSADASVSIPTNIPFLTAKIETSVDLKGNFTLRIGPSVGFDLQKLEWKQSSLSGKGGTSLKVVETINTGTAQLGK